MLNDKKILIGVTGSIAAYKTILLTRLLVKAGAEVKIVMTPAAKDFVSPLTLSTLSKNPVIIDLATDNSWANHVGLGRWADLFLIAPLSCNTLAKMAVGLCDNMLMATYLSATCPVAVAPAMDEDMWHHASTKANLKKLESYSNYIIPVGKGELASGLYGDGRMAEPEEILQYIVDNFFTVEDLKSTKALVTAGPTFEPIDPVRFIGNHSSGKMGIAIAAELARRGAEVQLILGPSAALNPIRGVTVVRVQTAEQMFEECDNIFGEVDVAVMSAAVADYTPIAPSHEKIKKEGNGAEFHLTLTKTTDILKTLGERKKPGQILVGFALETNDEKENALKKLKAKNADLVVLNSLNDVGAGFGFDTNKVTIFDRDGEVYEYPQKTKQQVAVDIVDKIVKLI